jgi:hypothetical protein
LGDFPGWKSLSKKKGVRSQESEYFGSGWLFLGSGKARMNAKNGPLPPVRFSPDS